ncbi:DUF6912 family protein [Demequina litorisediminis]|uniref:DUF4265 domain-containing protein n=1 Tax=Demequina litorisediminis TaxID=1849022 RepID=A0ABQ6IH91_9MICO|nr:hypothetical protein [Demequina litorisediminis]GMA36541.1 hypothetical protein GCM10025876_27450 [Demequina litorisediminis]
MRVYVPATFADLETISRGLFEPARGYALTHRMLEISSLDDEEEIAEQVRDAAAWASVKDLGSPVRVVIVVDHPRADVEELAGEHPAAVALQGRIGVAEIACAFIDEPDAVADVRSALDGGEDAREALEARDLLWWGPGELGSVPAPDASSSGA